MLEPEVIDRLKNQLEQMEAELSEDVEDKTQSTATVEVDSSIGRLSRVDAIQSQQIALGLKARQQQALLRVRSALEAIRNGAYGQCRRCKGPIRLERLEAQPDAVLCLRCAEASDRK